MIKPLVTRHTKNRSSEETALKGQIVTALEALGYNVEVVNSGKRGGVRMAKPGTPDLFVSRGNRFIRLEVKDLAKLSKSQVAWGKCADDRGERYAVVRSISEAVAAVGKAMR